MGKYTKGALGACHYAGWNQEGIIRFNQLCQKVKEDRENNPVTEELYKAHCLTMATVPKKLKTILGSSILMLMT